MNWDPKGAIPDGRPRSMCDTLRPMQPFWNNATGRDRFGPLRFEGDFNCLYQDVCGDLVFPLQVAFLLSVPGEDFTGAEFVLLEQGHGCSRGLKSCSSARERA